MQKLKDNVRNDILAAAAAEFNQRGFEKASMREIAANAGITPGNIYRYFKNKETLQEAVVLPIMKEINQALMDCTDGRFNLFTNNEEIIEKNEKFHIDISKFSESFVRINEKYRDGMTLISKNERYRNTLKEWLTVSLNAFFSSNDKNADPERLKILSSVASVALIEAITESLRYHDICRKLGIDEGEIIFQCISTILGREEEMV